MLNVLLRPLTLFVLFFLAYLIAYVLHPLVPFKWRPFLYRRYPIIPSTEEQRRDWRPALFLVIANILIFGIVLLITQQGL